MEYHRIGIKRIPFASFIPSFTLVPAPFTHDRRVYPVCSVADLCSLAKATVFGKPACFGFVLFRLDVRGGNGGGACHLHGVFQLHEYSEVLRIHGIRL